MNIHKLKIDYKYANAVYDGLKTFEVRLNDRLYQEGDIVEFSVNGYPFHPLNLCRFFISYILPSFPALDPRYVVFSICKMGS